MYSAAVTSSLLRATSNNIRYDDNTGLRLASEYNNFSLVRSSAAMATMKPIAASEALQGQEFWAKNKRLARPMSPHLTIYKPQVQHMASYWSIVTSLASYWSIVTILASHWSIVTILASDWSMVTILAPDWSKVVIRTPRQICIRISDWSRQIMYHDYCPLIGQ